MDVTPEPIVIIETARLILRRFCEKDLQGLYEYLSDKDVVKYEPYRSVRLSEVMEELAQRISTDEMIAVVLKANNKLIGNVYLGKRDFASLDLGYVFNKLYWGQHDAWESCDALIKMAFSTGIHRIYAECDPCNVASWRLPESLGFRKEAYLLQNVYF